MRQSKTEKVAGGVDVAFLSTTCDREVAMLCHGQTKRPERKGCVVLEIQQGLIDAAPTCRGSRSIPMRGDSLCTAHSLADGVVAREWQCTGG